MKQHILVIDDEPDIRDTVRDILEDEGYRVSVARNAEEGRHHLRESLPDLVLLDIWMPDVDGITLLKEWKEVSGGELPTPVVMMSGHGTVETAVEATRLGAYDFLEKPLSIAKLVLTLERALENRQLKDEKHRRDSARAPEPTGRSAVIQRLKEQVKRIAQHDTWVLMMGEPGSGRETFARYLHAHSPRADRPFVEVVVSSIAPGNASLELFGQEEDGKVKYGRLEQARGGTLFLDEVADMDLEVQAQLLGALETGSFLRVGGVEPVRIDIRVVAATGRNLEEEVEAGRFRKELFYQLNVVPVHIPALRDHPEDVNELLEYYSGYFATNERLPYRRFDVSAQNFLRQYDWPGNIRELKNLVQRLMILGSSEEIGVDEVKQALGAAPQVACAGVSVSFDQPLRDAREAFEKAYLAYQLDKHGGNVSEMAQEAGMERTHLYRKLKSLGIGAKEARKG
ncbi:MAG: sigma-54 dependent transcriptional regulator [Gammaproteobacteria bacterium]|jgi:two-component system, NtrC family, nitrogen regulation response regulator NtrX